MHYRLALVLGLLTVGCGGSDPQLPVSSSASVWAGAPLKQAVPKPDFMLTDDRGQPFDFQKQTAGKLTLLYYGYTNCPDVCPAHMATLAQTVKRLPADVRSRVAVVFVSVDPQRDTPDGIRQWLARFDPTFIGLTGTPAELKIAQLRAQVGVATAQPSATLRGGGYSVDHSGVVFAYTADNLDHLIYFAGVRPADQARDFERLVRDGWTGR